MNYIKLSKYDTANGEGIGTVLWVSGCSHQCLGCHNPTTWDFNVGGPYTDSVTTNLIDSLRPSYIKRLTLSGGDPLAYSNRQEVLKILKQVKQELPRIKVWCYTGFLFEDLKGLEILDYIDILVDGKFELSKKDLTLRWKGSANQRVIDVPKSLEQNRLCIYDAL